MKKHVFLIILMLIILAFNAPSIAEENFTSDYLTYMNGKWYYIDDTKPLNRKIMTCDSKSGEESMFSDKCVYNSDKNYIYIDGFGNDGKSIIVLDTYWKKIMRIEQDHVETICSISGNIPNSSANIAICGKYLFAKFDYEYNAYRIDMEDGSTKILSWPHVENLFAMSDGSLLVQQGAIIGSPERLQVYDPESCKEQNIIADFDANSYPSVAYDSENNHVYAAFSGAIWVLEQGNWSKVRNFQFSNTIVDRKRVKCDGSIFCVYYINDENRGWKSFRLDEDIELTPIVVGGSYTFGNYDGAYMNSHADQVIIKAPSLRLMSAVDLYTRLLAKDDGYDIYAIMYNSGVKKLIEQNLFEPLKGSAFDNYRQSLYEPIQNELSINNELFCIIENSSIFKFRVDSSQGVEPPQSVESLVDLLEHWNENPSNRGQPLLVYNGSYTIDNEDLLLICLQQLIYYHTRGNELWKSPEIISLLEKIRDADIPPKQELTTDMADKAVMHYNYSSLTLYDNDGLQPPLMLAENTPMLFPMDGTTVLLLNPYAKHPKEATEYLSYLCENVDLQWQTMLFSTLKAKLKDENVKYIESLLAEKEKSTSNNEKQKLDAEIERIKNDYYSYTASPVTLAMYREKIVPQLMLDTPLIMARNSQISIRDFLQDQVNRYLSQQIDTTSLLNNIYKWLEMSSKEGF